MTKDEAIIKLIIQKGYHARYGTIGEENIEALDMGIEALKRESFENACDLTRKPYENQTQPTGKWIEKGIDKRPVIKEWQTIKCSECEKYLPTPYMYFVQEYNYCPNCGAKMKGGLD